MNKKILISVLIGIIILSLVVVVTKGENNIEKAFSDYRCCNVTKYFETINVLTGVITKDYIGNYYYFEDRLICEYQLEGEVMEDIGFKRREECSGLGGRNIDDYEYKNCKEVESKLIINGEEHLGKAENCEVA